MHASMPPKQNSRRLSGYPPKSQERVEVGSTDEEASPPPGSARVDCNTELCTIHFDPVTHDKDILTELTDKHAGSKQVSSNSYKHLNT